MAIEGVTQPDIIMIDDKVRLRKFDGIFDFAYPWYQDEELVYLVDGERAAYDYNTLDRMYSYLEKKGELYFIEIMENEVYRPIGDLTFWRDDLPIVIGERAYWGKGIGSKIVAKMIERAKILGYDSIMVREIYDWNLASQRCFEKNGFVKVAKTERGSSYKLNL